jgi:multiple sugar transport system ATP-binding protein
VSVAALKAVEVDYPRGRALGPFSLSIGPGEIVALVGPSGCGKSTALRMAAGLEDISGGQIRIGGRVVNDVPPVDRDVAMVFQNYALYPHMSIRKNLEFGLTLRKVPRAEIDRLVNDAAEVLGITPLLDRRPKQLSGGQRQRVAVGRAIVRHPSVFLFDEPLSNLDAKLRVQMRAEIKRLQQRLGTTAVYGTHDQVEAMTMGHRIAVLKEGALQQVGTPLDVYQRPANAFVAQFIGSPPMNIVRARLEDGGARVVAPGLSLPVPAPLRPGLAAASGREVIAGIRPEHVLGPGAPARGEVVSVVAVVEIVETLGDVLVVHARAGESTLVFKQEPHRAPEVGAAVTLGLQVEHLHLFDGATERRLG